MKNTCCPVFRNWDVRVHRFSFHLASTYERVNDKRDKIYIPECNRVLGSPLSIYWRPNRGPVGHESPSCLLLVRIIWARTSWAPSFFSGFMSFPFFFFFTFSLFYFWGGKNHRFFRIFFITGLLSHFHPDVMHGRAFYFYFFFSPRRTCAQIVYIAERNVIITTTFSCQIAISIEKQ